MSKLNLDPKVLLAEVYELASADPKPCQEHLQDFETEFWETENPENWPCRNCFLESVRFAVETLLEA